MYPHERSLVKRLENVPFTLLGINSDPKKRIATRMVEERITWPFFWDGGNTNGPIASSWNVHSWPTTYVLDAKGVIRAKNLRGEELEKFIDTLLVEMGEKVPPPSTQPAEEK
jgi:hypothetical protein